MPLFLVHLPFDEFNLYLNFILFDWVVICIIIYNISNELEMPSQSLLVSGKGLKS